MIGHLRVPAIDSLPASLSRKIHTMLRSALGFEGLILTDALTMKALDDIPDASVRCLNAGADILLHPADPDETVKALISAISSGKLDEERIDAALSRIIKRKETLRDAVTRDVDFHAHAALSSQVANKSVSLIKCTPGAVPLAEGEDVHIFMAGDRDPASMSPLRSLSPKVWMLSGQSNYPDLRNATTIVAIFTSIAAWRGNPGISRNEQERIRRIITSSHKSMVLSFGNPYVLRHFPESDALLAAYDATGETQKTIVRWLTEPGVLYGKIPVTFP
jgi:beta-N-acetylhexosaminidase